MFSCQFCEISKSIFFTEHLWTTASKGNISLNSWSASPVAVLIKHPSLGLFCKVTALHCINVSVFGVILVRIFPSFSRIRTEYGEIISSYSVQMRENVGKMWTRIIPNTDTFHAVLWLKTLL